MNALSFVLEYNYKLCDQWRWKIAGTLMWTYCDSEHEARSAMGQLAQSRNKWAHIVDLSVMKPLRQS